ncbi:MAG: VIT1/CCC1 transporter family protein [Pseudonocardiaceae bacterium]
MAQLSTEERELHEAPDAELAELTAIYQAKGLTPATVHTVARELTWHPLFLRRSRISRAAAHVGQPRQRVGRPARR